MMGCPPLPAAGLDDERLSQMRDVSALFRPGSIGRLTVPNRIVLAPLTTRMASPDGAVSAREIAYLVARARGGAGLLVSAPVLSSTTHEAFSGSMARADHDRFLPGLARMVEAVHDAGGLISVQLSPGSGRLGPSEPGGIAPVSASPTPSVRDPAVACRPLSEAEIVRAVRDFGAAADRLARADVDAIDVHGHGGFLVDQFLSGLWNQRTDGWGGSVAARARFALALVGAVKDAVPGLPVSFRLSTVHHLPGGREVEESLEIAGLLEEAGIDLLICEEGAAMSPAWMAPATYVAASGHLASAATIARRLTIPVMVAGSLTPERAAQAVGDGEIAFAGMGRALLADPDLPRALAAGRPDLVRPCVRCNACLDAVRSGHALRCAVNPLAGREAGVTVRRAVRPRRVAVVGGGPAGLEAARVAALRGHVVDLYEARGVLGGTLADAAAPPFKAELRELVRWYERVLRALDVTVHLDRPVRPGSSVLSRAEVVVVATGGDPVRPLDVAGLRRPEVVDVRAMHLGAPVGRRVVVAGGGFAGCDAALVLAIDGHQVTVLEESDELASGAAVVQRGALLAALEANGVELRTGTRLVSIDDDGVQVDAAGERSVVRADTVVLALGVRTCDELLGPGALEDPRVWVVGDASAPGDVGSAIHSAFGAALAF